MRIRDLIEKLESVEKMHGNLEIELELSNTVEANDLTCVFHDSTFVLLSNESINYSPGLRRVV